MTVSLVNTWISLTVKPTVLEAKTLLSDEELPMLTVVCPLYREPNVVKQLFNAITALKYPKDKIELMWVLERDDTETRDAIRRDFKDIVYEDKYPIEIGGKVKILYNIKRRMKANSLNLALEKATGEYLVVYDADTIPEPDQAIKAMTVFKENSEYDLLQAFITTYNTDENFFARLYEGEFERDWDYSTRLVNFTDGYFNLKGHSFFVRTEVARAIGGWREVVTEDLDFGINLAINGYKMGIFKSVTQEEAPHTMRQNLRSRTRVNKGFIKLGVTNSADVLSSKIGWKKAFAILDLTVIKIFEKLLLLPLTALLIYVILFGAMTHKIIAGIAALFVFGTSVVNYYKITKSLPKCGSMIFWDLFTCIFMYTGLVSAILNPNEFTVTGHTGRVIFTGDND